MKLFCLPILLLALSPFVLGQRTTLVLRDGDPVAGVGNLTSIDALVGIDDEGRLLAWIDTDAADTASDGVLVSGAGPVLREGEPMTQPAGTTLDSVDGWAVDGAGGFFATVSLDGAASGEDEAAYWNDSLLLREGGLVGAAELSSGTVWKQLFEVWSASSNRVLLACNVDDPNLPSSTERALVRLELNAAGQVVTRRVIAAEGSQFSASLPVLADLGVAPQSAAMNANGDVLYQARFAGVDAASDVALFVGSTLLYREGDASPVAGRAWEILWGRPVDMNDSGALVVRGNLDGAPENDEVLLLGSSAGGPSRVIAREGDSLLPFEGESLESFGLNSPVHLAADESVLWYADWTGVDETRDSGLILTQLDHPNPDFVHQVLIREGVTRIEGLLVDSIAAEPGGYAMSRSGRFVLCEVRFVGGIDGLVVIDRIGPQPSFCEGDIAAGAQCEPCPCGNEVPVGLRSGCRHSGGVGAELVPRGDATLSADSLRFEVASGVPSSFALLVSGTDRLPANPSHPCFGLDTGVSPGNLDGLQCVGGTQVLHGVRRSDAAGDVGRVTPGFGPPDRPLQGLGAQGGYVAGQTRHFQVWMRDTAQGGCQTGLATTNGRTVMWLP